jgi:hypothetical protein
MPGLQRDGVGRSGLTPRQSQAENLTWDQEPRAGFARELDSAQRSALRVAPGTRGKTLRQGRPPAGVPRHAEEIDHPSRLMIEIVDDGLVVDV